MQPISIMGLFLGYCLVVAGCLYWHNRQASRHLLLMAWGMAAVALLTLPALFDAWAGHDELIRYASKILKPAVDPDFPRSIIFDPAYRLLNYCYHLSGIGLAVFAVGLWRLAKELVLKVRYPRPDQA